LWRFTATERPLLRSNASKYSLFLNPAGIPIE
jgi:hypothetical protein